MKIFVAFLTIFFAMQATAVPAFANLSTSMNLMVADASKSVLLVGGTEVDINMVETISSASAVVGDKFSFRASKNVIVDGMLIIARGASGEGWITSVEKSGGNGHAGKLGLQFDYIYGVDGEKISLTDANNAHGEEKKGASSTATIVGYALLGPVGLFAHNFVHGRQMEITPATTMAVFVDHNVHIIASRESGYAK